MADSQLKKRIYKLHLALYRELNDIHIFMAHTIPLLKETTDRYKAMPGKADKPFLVPSSKGKKGIAKRTPQEVASIFESFANRDLHANMLVSCVSRLESMLNDVLRAYLSKYPEKLSVGLKGGESAKTVPIATVIEAEDIKELHRTVANARLQGVFYAEPKDYLAYFENITGVKLPEPTFLAFVEIKATRDIIIHNDGIVNELYKKKTGDLSRAQVGETIPLDETYFASSISAMKAISSAIDKQIKAGSAPA